MDRVRQQRMRQIVDIGHSFGLNMGADVPIVLSQQHSFRLLRNVSGCLEDEIKEIQQNVDYILDMGFDFIGTESGYTEFTHPTANQMLGWLSGLADYTFKFNVQTWVKVTSFRAVARWRVF